MDCSQVKTKLKLIRYIAKEFGVTSNGRYSDVYEDLVAYLRTIDTPLVILDEAGDLQYEAFLAVSYTHLQLHHKAALTVSAGSPNNPHAALGRVAYRGLPVPGKLEPGRC